MPDAAYEFHTIQQRIGFRTGRNKMETEHTWLINILAIQVACLIGMGYRICFLAKRDLLLAKSKTSNQNFLRVRRSPRIEILFR